VQWKQTNKKQANKPLSLSFLLKLEMVLEEFPPQTDSVFPVALLRFPSIPSLSFAFLGGSCQPGSQPVEVSLTLTLSAEATALSRHRTRVSAGSLGFRGASQTDQP